MAMAPASIEGSVSSANSTSHAPSANSLAWNRASSWARRVFPIPPAPSKVTSCALRTRGPSSARSLSRPTKLLTDRPRLWCSGSRSATERIDRLTGGSDLRTWARTTNASKLARSAPESPSARTSSARVSRRGVAPSPRSQPLMLRTLTPASSANSSCVSSAARR